MRNDSHPESSLHLAGPDDETVVLRHRVVLVSWQQGQAAEILALIPADTLPRRAELPALVLATPIEAEAQKLAGQLALLGCGVVIVQHVGDSVSACSSHSGELSTEVCRGCGAPICAICRLEAKGEAWCSTCLRTRRREAQWTRTRQLFILFVLVALFYQVQRLQERVVTATTPIESVRVAVLQFVPPQAYHHPLVRGLSGFDPKWTGPTIKDIGTFFDEERRRYTGSAGNAVTLSLRGPWRGTPTSPGLPAADAGWFGVVLGTWKYRDFWNQLSEDHGVDRSLWTARLFVIYRAGEGDFAAESRASGEERVAVAYVSLDDPNPAYPALTLAHELAHAIGATDKYGAESRAVFPEGYVEPFSAPLYPQRFAELMAVDVPLAHDAEREPRGLDEVRVGYRTAAEVGWISHDVADAFYLTGGPSPSDLLKGDPDTASSGVVDDASLVEGFVEGGALAGPSDDLLPVESGERVNGEGQ